MTNGCVRLFFYPGNNCFSRKRELFSSSCSADTGVTLFVCPKFPDLWYQLDSFPIFLLICKGFIIVDTPRFKVGSILSFFLKGKWFIGSFSCFCFELFGLILWQGSGEMYFEADAGVFQDRFRHFRTTRFVKKGYFFGSHLTSNCLCFFLFEEQKLPKVTNQISI